MTVERPTVYRGAAIPEMPVARFAVDERGARGASLVVAPVEGEAP